MAIAFDAATDGGNNGGSGNLTFAHTCGTGDNRILYVGFSGNAWNATNYVAGVTYNGVALTEIGYRNSGFGWRQLHLWRLTAPPSGTHNVVIAISGAQPLIAIAASYSGASPSTQPTTSAGSTGGTLPLTTSYTTPDDNCWTLLLESGYPGTTTGSGTERTHDAASTSTYFFDTNGPVGVAGIYSQSTTRSGVGYSGPCLHLMIAVTEAVPQPVNGVVTNCCTPGETAGPNPIGSLGWTPACDGGGIVDAVADLDDGEYWG